MSDTFNVPQIADLATDSTTIDNPLTEDQERVVREAWIKLDDLFDSLEGGPHLKDRSKTGFSSAKSALLLDYAIAKINYGNPILSFTSGDFPYDTDSILLSQALVIEIIQHLIRSYTEQPTPQGSGYARLSRKDYSQAWQQTLQTEQKIFDDMVRYFRRKYLNLGNSAGLIDMRHSRVFNPNVRAQWRARGWYGYGR